MSLTPDRSASGSLTWSRREVREWWARRPLALSGCEVRLFAGSKAGLSVLQARPGSAGRLGHLGWLSGSRASEHRARAQGLGRQGRARHPHARFFFPGGPAGTAAHLVVSSGGQTSDSAVGTLCVHGGSLAAALAPYQRDGGRTDWPWPSGSDRVLSRLRH